MADFGFTSEDVIREVLGISPRVLLSFSTGKDSIAAYLAIREAGFEDIQPFYLYQVPGNLEFIEESLSYYERTLFGGRRVIRMPHPYLWAVMRNMIHQPPERVELIQFFDFAQIEHEEVQQFVLSDLGWPDTAMTAVGVRAADSQNRYAMFKRHGMRIAVNVEKRKFYPVFDWNKERALSAIRKSGVRLPVDYRVFGRTFDGFDARFLAPMKQYFPNDYRRILEWVPMADAEFFRHEHRQAAP